MIETEQVHLRPEHVHLTQEQVHLTTGTGAGGAPHHSLPLRYPKEKPFNFNQFLTQSKQEMVPVDNLNEIDIEMDEEDTDREHLTALGALLRERYTEGEPGDDE